MPLLSTYTPSDALLASKAFIKSMPIDNPAPDPNFKYKILDMACSLVWMAAPWWWTLGVLPNVSLVAATQDYAVAPPTDFAYLVRAVVSDASTQADLKVVSILPSAETQVGVPSQVSYVAVAAYPTLDTIRIAPVPPASYAATANLTYKRQPPKIVAGNFSTAGAMILPDAYFPVIEMAVLYFAYLYADDNRAGNVTVNDKGEVTYTQTIGSFMAMLAMMRQSESLLLEYPGLPKVR